MIADVSKKSGKKNDNSTSNIFIKYGVIIAIVVVIIIFSLTTKSFFSLSNIFDIIRTSSILVVVAMGVTISVVVNGFDLSVGAVSGFSSIICLAFIILYNVPWYLAVIFTLIIGLFIGYITSLLITKIKIPDLLASLSMSFIVVGMQFVVAQGSNIFDYMTNPWNHKLSKTSAPPAFDFISKGNVFKFGDFSGIPFIIFLMIAVVLFLYFFLEKTKTGRILYSIGKNSESVTFSGININRYKTLAYMLSGVCATLGGIMLASRIGSGEIRGGDSFMLESVAATYFGFAVLGLKRPNILGTMVGALFVGIMLNGLTMLGFTYYIQDTIKGIILLIALGVTFYLMKKR